MQRLIFETHNYIRIQKHPLHANLKEVVESELRIKFQDVDPFDRPRSRPVPVVITIFTHIVRPSVLTFQKLGVVNDPLGQSGGDG